MKLQSELFNRIVDLLHPHMAEGNRRSLIIPIFLAHDSIYSRIEWSGNNREFTIKLVAQLVTYGKVESDEESLILLLEGLQNHIGLDDQQEIEGILQQIESIHSVGVTKWTNSRKRKGDPWNSISIIIISILITLLVLLILKDFQILNPEPEPSSEEIVTHTPTLTRIYTATSDRFLELATAEDIPKPSTVYSIRSTVSPTTELIGEVIPNTSTLSPQDTPTLLPTGTPIPTSTRTPTITLTVTPTDTAILDTSNPPTSIGITSSIEPISTISLLPTETPIPSSTPTSYITPTKTSTVAPTDTATLDISNPPVSIGITFPVEPLSTTLLSPIGSTGAIEIREQSNVIEVPQGPD